MNDQEKQLYDLAVEEIQRLRLLTGELWLHTAHCDSDEPNKCCSSIKCCVLKAQRRHEEARKNLGLGKIPNLSLDLKST